MSFRLLGGSGVLGRWNKHSKAVKSQKLHISGGQNFLDISGQEFEFFFRNFRPLDVVRLNDGIRWGHSRNNCSQ